MNKIYVILIYLYNNYFHFFKKIEGDYCCDRYNYDLEFLGLALLCIILCKQVGKYTNSSFLEGFLKVFPIAYMIHTFYIKRFAALTPPELQVDSFYFFMDSLLPAFYGPYKWFCILFGMFYLFQLYLYLMNIIEEEERQKTILKEQKEKDE